MIRFRAWWLPLLLLAILGGTRHFSQPEASSPSSTSLLPQRTAPDIRPSPWLDDGLPVSLTLRFQDGESPLTLHLRPSHWLAGDFRISLGTQGQPLTTPTHSWQGFAYRAGQTRSTTASLITIGDHACVQMLEPSGATLTFPITVNSRQVEGWRTAASPPHHCDISPEGIATLRAFDTPTTTITPVLATMEIAAQGGFEPGTGQLDRYVEPILLSEQYALSLKNLSLLLVMDKDSTGSNDPDNLAMKASQRLASIANVATVYENQLGVRLRLQELMMIPNTSEFEDIGSANLFPDFLKWLSAHRPQSTYRWTSALKIGLGLNSMELGSAFVGSIGRSDSVGVIRPSAGWDTLAHELGHGLGARHTVGGIMNASANGGGNRSFFTSAAFNDAPTAAQEIYRHARGRLGDPETALRNPQEIPFAQNDFRQTPVNTAVRFFPLANDLMSTPDGRLNAAISLEDVSQVTPPNAGIIRRDQDALVFTPSADYQGAAWFSYSLRGSLGNERQGWLHKGDVSILVGTPEARPFELSLAPGQIFTFFPDTLNGPLSQPEQAQIQWLTDAVSQLLIRVQADATGSDSFTIGSQTYQITYKDRPTLKPQPAVYWQHPQTGTQRYYAGTQHLQSDPWVGDSVAGEQVRFFPGSDQLISAELLHPNKGTLEIERLPVTRNGRSALLPTGELRFTPNLDATGAVVIQLVFEDATGSLHDQSITIHLSGEAQSLVPLNALARYTVPTSAADANRWMLNAFNDRSWSPGSMPVGYEDGRGYEDVIKTDVARQMVNRNASIYLRIPFIVEDPSAFTTLLLRARIDDGLVVYLNGKAILQDNAPADLTWSSQATGSREAGTFLDFDVSDARKLLFAGQNLLAIHGLNATAGSSDFLIMPELLALTSPRLATITSPSATSVSIPENTGIQFRAQLNPNTTLPTTGDITTTWQIIEAPSNAPLDIDLTESQADVAFTEPGTYRMRLRAQDASQIITDDELVIRVGDSQDFDHLGDRIVAGMDIVTETPEIQLLGQQEPGTPGFEGTPFWTQISGPPGVRFGDPDSLTTTATLPSKGTYRLRLISATDTLTVFDDLIVHHDVSHQALIASKAPVHFWIPDQPVPEGWKQADLNDHGWRAGINGLGYDTSNDFARNINTDLRQELQLRHPSLYLRYPFQLRPDQVISIENLTLTMIADDGYVAYLNGREVARQNAPLSRLNGTSTAVQDVNEGSFNDPLEIDLTEHSHLLRSGANLLAVHALNNRVSSSDFLISASLTATLPNTPAGPETFQSWLTNYPTLPANARFPNSDWDQDQLSNLLEYALGSSPIQPDALQAWTIEATPDTITLRHPQRSDLQALGGSLVIESSPSLTQDTWQEWSANQTQTHVQGDGLWQSTHRGPRTDATTFFRLRVSFQ